MGLFHNPQNLPESFGWVMIILNLAGLFPFHFEVAEKKFRISRKYIILTVLHFSLFTYVNITSLMENWKDVSQPMIGQSSLTAFANLVLRLLSIIITFLILGPLLVGSRYFVSFLNIYVDIIEEYILLGIDVKCIYRRIYLLSVVASILIAISLVFTAWHSIYFYEKITGQPPAIKYYLMVFLDNFYKILFMFYGNVQLFAIFLISKQLNGFVDDFVTEYREKYEREKLKRDVMGNKLMNKC